MSMCALEASGFIRQHVQPSNKATSICAVHKKRGAPQRGESVGTSCGAVCCCSM